MKKIVALSIAAAALSLGACSKPAEEANTTTANVVEENAAGEVIEDINATTENAVDAAGAALENAAEAENGVANAM